MRPVEGRHVNLTAESPEWADHAAAVNQVHSSVAFLLHGSPTVSAENDQHYSSPTRSTQSATMCARVKLTVDGAANERFVVPVTTIS